MPVLRVLLDIDKKLRYRVSNNKWFYTLWMGIASLLIVFISYVSYNERHLIEDKVISFSLLAALLIIFDILALLLRINNRTFIEPIHLNIYPISKWQKFKFHFLLLLLDHKTALYIITFLSVSLIYFQNNVLYGFVLTVWFWLLLLLVMITWTIVVYNAAGQLILKHRKNISNLVLLLLVMPILLSQFFEISALTKIPLVGNMGWGLYGILVNNMSMVFKNILYLSGFVAIGLSVFMYLNFNIDFR